MGSVDLESFEKDLSNLFLNDLLVGLHKEVEDDAGKVVGVVVGIPQLVNNRVQEAPSSLVVELVHHLLEQLHRFLVRHLKALLGESLVSNKENHSIDDVGVDLPSSIYYLFYLHHLLADGVD